MDLAIKGERIWRVNEAPFPRIRLAFQTKALRCQRPILDQNGTDFVSGAPTPQTAAFPTAAGVSISGRVMSGERGIRNAFVTISGGDLGQPITVSSGPRGEFVFDDIAAGRTYIVSVAARRFQFNNSSLIVEANDNVAGINFYADGR